MLETTFLDESHLVRRLREKIRRWWQVEVAFADARGYVEDHAHGIVVPPHNAFCQAALSSGEGFKRCNKSVEQATQEVVRSGRQGAHLVHSCHLGFPIVMAPVVHLGRFFGTIFCSGFLVEGADIQGRATNSDSAAKLSLVIDDPERDLESIPVLTNRDVKYLCDMMDTIADEVIGQLEHRRDHERFGGLVGTSTVMKGLYSLLEKVANSDATVLITGENGTGKELAAHAVHDKGPRCDTVFVATNCSALNDNLLESELFGHVKGAFTGAIREKDGLFQVADSGTLFLDEVGDMSAAMQVKLLRVLQEGTFMPVGATRPQNVDVRVIAATNRSLVDMVKSGAFREDLYYRLSVICVDLPPLRDRKGDLRMLCEHFLEKVAKKTNTKCRKLAPEVLRRFWEYDWPGNIRQLQNEIERLVVLSDDEEVIGGAMLSPAIARRTTNVSTTSQAEGSLMEAVRELETSMIRAGLIRTGWNKSRLARDLCVSRTTLIKKIRELGLEDEQMSTR